MIPQDFESFPVFGDNGQKVQPGEQKYAAGFVPGDVLPAVWLNWFLNTLSKGYNQLVQHANEGFVRTISETPAQPVAPSQEMSIVIDTAGVALTLGSGSYVGYTLPVLAQMACTVTYTASGGSLTDNLSSGSKNIYTWTGAYWICSDQHKPPIGVPTLWFADKPDWAIDFGNGANTKYLWSNYPELNNAQFKGILDKFKATGGSNLCADYDSSGFYVPDLRGMIPKAVGTSGKSYGHDAIANVGAVLTERLPNIKGNLDFATNQYIGSPQTASATGSFGGGTTKSTYYTQPQGPSAGNYGFTFNAHNSNAIYTDSAHVSPLSVGAMWIVRFE